MNQISFKTSHLIYEISNLGQNLQFTSSVSGQNRILSGPCATITNHNHSVISSISASFDNDILTVIFEDDTIAKILVNCNEEYITFTLEEVSREDFLNISFINIELDDESENFFGCLMGMTLATHMQEHPGDNRCLRASAYPHIGLFNTKKSQYPAKAAIIGCDKNFLRNVQRNVLAAVPKGELPISYKGGPYADMAKQDSKGSYVIFMETVNPNNVEDVIDSMHQFGITQIILHHCGHYIQGDFRIRGNGVSSNSDFKYVIDRLHQEGFLVGLQTYSFFLDPASTYVTPTPHKDLDILREFTLKSDVDITDTIINVNESTDGVTPIQGYVDKNSPYVWIDDEIIRFSKVDNGCFTICERGSYGTTVSTHKKGASVRQLKQCFFLPCAKAGSDLFYEIARNTANFYNECNADFFYLDALDGSFILDGEDYVWYHAVDFIHEMFKYLKSEPIFDCCYNPQYTGSWFVRSRYGAIDVSLCAHRQYADAHVNYNNKTAKRMGITPELGWIELHPAFSYQGELWQNQPFFAEELEYFCAKAFATEASIAFTDTFHVLKSRPCSKTYSEILRKYAIFCKNNLPTEITTNYLQGEGNGAILENDTLYKAKHITSTIEHTNDWFNINNPFKSQMPSLRIEAMCAADCYDNPKAITLCTVPENEPIKNHKFDFDSPINAHENRGLGVWCCGDGSGAIVCIKLRSKMANKEKVAEHFIKVNFTGWKYFAFYEHENGMLPTDEWPRTELEYTTYNSLQKFYDHYRANMDYSTLCGIDIYVKGSGNIFLKPIRLVPHCNPTWKNPKITIEDSSITFNADLKAEHVLYFDGNNCVITDKTGNVLEYPQWSGSPILSSGNNHISISHDDESELPRAKITVTIRGDKLQ